MIRKHIIRVLNETLGGFIEEVTADSLTASVRSGKASLENVRVRPECMQEMGLPVTLNAGTIGSIEIDIPLTALRSKPIVVTIKDVLVSLSPNPEVNVKRVMLKKQIIKWNRLVADDTDPIDMNSKLGRLVGKIIDNIVIVIEDVHIRMEDTISSQRSWHDPSTFDPTQCFALGITLDRVELQGCIIDEKGVWEEGCLKGATRFLNKRVVIGTHHQASAAQTPGRERRAHGTANPSGIGIYCHSEELPIAADNLQEWAKDMRGFIASKHWRAENQWLLSPVSATASVSIDKHKQYTECASRVWSLVNSVTPPLDRVILSDRGGHSTVVSVSASLLRKGKVHFHWAFEASDNHVRFRVDFRAPQANGLIDRKRPEIVEPSQSRAAHLRRVYGRTAVSSPGEFEIYWEHVPGRTSSQELGHVTWFRVVHPNGRTEDIDPGRMRRMRDVVNAAVRVNVDDGAGDSGTVAEDAAALAEAKKSVAKKKIDEMQRDNDRKGSKNELAVGDLPAACRQLPHQCSLPIGFIMPTVFSFAITEWITVRAQIEVNEFTVHVSHEALRKLVATQRFYANIERWKRLAPLRPMEVVGSEEREVPGEHHFKFFPLWRNLPNGGNCAGCYKKKMTQYCSVCFLCEECAKDQGSCVASGPPSHKLRSLSVIGGARLWWNFAIQCTIQINQEDSLTNALRRIRDGREYSILFRRTFAAGRAWLGPLSEADKARLSELEDQLPLRMLEQRRLQAWSQLHQEEQGKDHNRRDFTELSNEIVQVPADSWATNPTDEVLFSSQMRYEKTVNRSPKERWVVLVRVRRFLATAISGWALLAHEKKKLPWEKPDRLWFRLKGDLMRFHSDCDDKTTRGEINVSKALSVDNQASDRTIVRIETDKREFWIKFDSQAESELWIRKIGAIIEDREHQHCDQRWLVVYKTAQDAKPIEAMPLVKGSYTMEAPRVPRKDSPFQVIVQATLLTFQVKECVIAAASPAGLVELASILGPDAAQVLHEEISTQNHTSLSTNQAAMISSLKTVRLDKEDSDDEEEGEHEQDEHEECCHGSGDYYMNTLEIKLAGITVTLGNYHHDWASFQLSSIDAIFENTHHHALNLILSIHNIVVKDLYSRDTCYEKILFRNQMNPTPMIQLRVSMVVVKQPPDEQGNVESIKEEYLDLVMQPLHVVCNPSLLPALHAFFRLKEDAAIENMSHEVQRKAREKIHQLKDNSFLTRLIHQKEREDVDDVGLYGVQLCSSVRLGSVHIVLPSEFFSSYESAVSAVITMRSFRASTDDDMTTLAYDRQYDVYHAAIQELEIFCCERDELIFMSGHGDYSHDSLHEYGMHGHTGLEKRYLLEPMTLPVHIQKSTGRDPTVDKFVAKVHLEALKLKLTTAALKEFMSVLTAAYSTMNVRRVGLSRLLVSKADAKRQKRRSKDKAKANSTPQQKTDYHCHAPKRISLADSGRAKSMDAKGDQSDWLIWWSTTPATVRFEFVLGDLEVLVGVAAGGSPSRKSMTGGQMDQVVDFSASDLSFGMVSRHGFDCYGISVCSLKMESGFEDAPRVITISAGVVFVVPTDITRPSRRFGYKTEDAEQPAEPKKVVPMNRAVDFMAVVPEAEVRRLVEMLQFSVRVASVAEWLLVLVGKQQAWMKTAAWAEAVGEMEETAGMERSPVGAFSPPSVLRYLIDKDVAQSSGTKLLTSLFFSRYGLVGKTAGVVAHKLGVDGRMKDGVRTLSEMAKESDYGAKAAEAMATKVAGVGGDMAAHLHSQMESTVSKLRASLDSRRSDAPLGTAAAGEDLVKTSLEAVAETVLALSTSQGAELDVAVIDQLLAKVNGAVEQHVAGRVAEMQDLVPDGALAGGLARLAGRAGPASRSVAVQTSMGPEPTAASALEVAGLGASVFVPTELDRAGVVGLVAGLGHSDVGEEYIDGLLAQFGEGGVVGPAGAEAMRRFLLGEGDVMAEPDEQLDEEDPAHSSLYYQTEAGEASAEIEMETVTELVGEGVIDDHTLVFADGMASWTPFGECKFDFEW